MSKQTYMHDVLENLPAPRARVIATVAAKAMILLGLIFGLAMVLCSAHAAEKRPYIRILPVAYWNGIDKEPRPVGRALAPGTVCDDKLIEDIKTAQRIPASVTVACKAWTPKSDDNL